MITLKNLCLHDLDELKHQLHALSMNETILVVLLTILVLFPLGFVLI